MTLANEPSMSGPGLENCLKDEWLSNSNAYVPLPSTLHQSLISLIRLPAALLDQSGKLLTRNAPMQALTQQEICVRHTQHRLYIRRQGWEAFKPDSINPTGMFEDRERIHRLGLEQYKLVEMPLGNEDLLGEGYVLIYILGPAPAALPRTRTLKRLFHLTRCEAKVAQLLLKGLCVKRIARQTQRSEYTIREHLKSTLYKTNSSGQASLVSLLASLPVS